MKGWLKILAALLSLLSLAATAIPSFADSTPPQVQAIASRGYFHFSNDSDVITNTPVQWNKWLHLDLVNQSDPGHIGVQNPKAVLETGLSLSDFRPEMQAPYSFAQDVSDPSNKVYTWDWQGLTVHQPSHLPMSATEGVTTAKPGFTGARAVTPETLTEKITRQTVTFTFRLEQPLPEGVDNVGVAVGSTNFAYGPMNNPLITGKVLSYEPVGDSVWATSDDGFSAMWHARSTAVKIGQTYVFKAVLEETKSDDLIGSPISKPEVAVLFTGQDPSDIVPGNSLEMAAPDGSYKVTFSADNVVNWQPSLMKARYQYHLQQQLPRVVGGQPGDQPPYRVEIPATVRIEPETLNLSSNGVITATLQLPSGYDVSDVRIDTVRCQGASATKANTANDKLVLKFRRGDLQNVGPGSSVPFTVTGQLVDGTSFVANTTVNVKR